MARPKKQTVDYFPHQCNHGKTIFVLEEKYGNDGYAFWFKLLEQLGASDGHFLDLNNKTTWNFLRAKSRLSEKQASEILDLLADMEAIDKALWMHRIVWSENFMRGITDAYRNRIVDIPTRPKVKRAKQIKKQEDKQKISYVRNPEDGAGNSHTKLNDTILDDTKLNETKEKNLSVEAVRLATLLSELILLNKPDYRELNNGTKEKSINRWSEDIDKMIRLDERLPDNIEKVIVWSQKDSFWFKNILSGSTLRKQFDRLQMEMVEPGRKLNDKHAGIDEWLREGFHERN